MQFHEFAERLLGSKVKIKILRQLLTEESLPGEREAAKRMGISHVAVNKALAELHDLNLVNPIRAGNVKIWHLNKDSYAHALLNDFAHKIGERPLVHLKRTILDAFSRAPQAVKITLFGSVAEGRETPESDIDLLIVVANEKGKREIEGTISSLNETCLKLYGNPISAHVFTQKELKKPLHRKLLEAVSKGILLLERIQ